MNKEKFYLRVVKIPFKKRIYHRFCENGERKEEVFDFPLYFVKKTKAAFIDFEDIWGEYKNFLTDESYLLVKEKQLDKSSYNPVEPNLSILFKVLNYPYPIKYRKELMRILNIDIEVYSEKEFPKPDLAKFPIVSITCQDMIRNKFYVFALKEAEIKQDNVYFKQYKSEKEMLISFLKFYLKFQPDIITGWYINGFDIPYIKNRIKNLFSDKIKQIKALAVLSLASKKLMDEMNILFEHYDLQKVEDFLDRKFYGVAVLDYMDLYKKFQLKKLSSYSLDSVANYELGEHKLDYSEYLSLKNLYKENFQKFIEYNIRDVELVYLIDKKVKFIDLTLLMSYAARSDFEDVLGVVKRWENRIFYYLMTKYKKFFV